ncbi:MAG: hypothetical protein CMO40_08240 [Verrucomicrobiaceae bacterium]|nr:hypothetical protein [Verrucomicrobiaceae bacterium]
MHDAIMSAGEASLGEAVHGRPPCPADVGHFVRFSATGCVRSGEESSLSVSYHATLAFRDQREAEAPLLLPFRSGCEEGWR